MITAILSSGNWLPHFKPIAKYFRSNDASILFAELCNKYEYFRNEKKLDKDGYFYATSKAIEEETNISKYWQGVYLPIFEKEGLIKREWGGMPRKRKFKIIATQKKIEKIIEKGLSGAVSKYINLAPVVRGVDNKSSTGSTTSSSPDEQQVCDPTDNKSSTPPKTYKEQRERTKKRTKNESESSPKNFSKEVNKTKAIKHLESVGKNFKKELVELLGDAELTVPELFEKAVHDFIEVKGHEFTAKKKKWLEGWVRGYARNQDWIENQHYQTKKKKQAKADIPTQIFDYWDEVNIYALLPRQREQLAGMVLGIAKEGYTVEEIKQTIDNGKACEKFDLEFILQNRKFYKDHVRA